LPRPLVRPATGQNHSKRVDTEPGQNGRNSSTSSHAPQQEQVFPRDLLTDGRYHRTAAGFPFQIPPLPPRGCLMRPCNILFLGPEPERWKEPSGQRPRRTPPQAAAQLTARAAGAGTASPPSLPPHTQPGQAPARREPGRPAQVKEPPPLPQPLPSRRSPRPGTDTPNNCAREPPAAPGFQRDRREPSPSGPAASRAPQSGCPQGSGRGGAGTHRRPEQRRQPGQRQQDPQHGDQRPPET